MFSQDQTDRVRRGWAVAAMVRDRTAHAFYANLFRLAPETQPLFRSNPVLQGRKLTETLAFIVDHLDAPEALLPAARALAVRHVAFGVRADHYPPVGAALIQTLRDLLGTDFTAADEAAWTEIYQALSSEMCNAAYGDRSPILSDRSA